MIELGSKMVVLGAKNGSSRVKKWSILVPIDAIKGQIWASEWPG